MLRFFLKNVGVLFVEEEESGDLVRAEIIRCMRMSLWMQCSVGSCCRGERLNINLSGDGLGAAGENEGCFIYRVLFLTKVRRADDLSLV